MNVSVSAYTNPPRITLKLVTAGKLGYEVAFSPIRPFSMNPFAGIEIADHLIVRVDPAPQPVRRGRVPQLAQRRLEDVAHDELLVPPHAARQKVPEDVDPVLAHEPQAAHGELVRAVVGDGALEVLAAHRDLLVAGGE